MNRRKSKLHLGTGLLLVALLPTMSASISALDMMPEDGRCGIESHHHAGTHGPRHNHLICIQQSANQWVQACAMPPSPLAVEILLPPAPEPTPPGHSVLCSLPHSRAPPPA